MDYWMNGFRGRIIRLSNNSLIQISNPSPSVVYIFSIELDFGLHHEIKNAPR